MKRSLGSGGRGGSGGTENGPYGVGGSAGTRVSGKDDEESPMSGRYPIFWRSLPGLNRIVRPGGMRTSFPVLGLRPMPRFRGFT